MIELLLICVLGAPSAPCPPPPPPPEKLVGLPAKEVELINEKGDCSQEDPAKFSSFG